MSSFQSERDTIAGLGLLTSHYVRFDPAVSVRGKATHAHGFNVHCLVVDNVDGEVLAIDRNRIYADQNPLQHAEQVAVREALERLHAKYPCPEGMSIDDYIRKRLFMAPGQSERDFIDVGCTLYNTFDPCGFCAVTLLVCYMKRIAFLFEDKKFDGVYEKMREYFRNRESVKEPLVLAPFPETADTPTNENPLFEGARLIHALRERVKAKEDAGTALVMTLDAEHQTLGQASDLFLRITPEHLTTEGCERERNIRTLAGIRAMLNLH
ncbi:MAG: hypothetical protein U1A77_18730 [Pirellulales bacterium]